MPILVIRTIFEQGHGLQIRFVIVRHDIVHFAGLHIGVLQKESSEVEPEQFNQPKSCKHNCCQLISQRCTYRSQIRTSQKSYRLP